MQHMALNMEAVFGYYASRECKIQHFYIIQLFCFIGYNIFVGYIVLKTVEFYFACIIVINIVTITSEFQ